MRSKHSISKSNSSKARWPRAVSVKSGREASQRRRQPFKLGCFDLRNPIDIYSAHQLVSNLGLWADGHEGLFQFAMAAVMARRLGSRNPHGYLARIVQRGLWGKGLHGPAERDERAAKEIMAELDLVPTRRIPA